MGNKRRFGRYTIELTNEGKVLFPGAGYTKGDLIGYYEDIAEAILPYLLDRPLNLERFPDGIDREGFYQKEVPGYFPSWIQSVEVPLKGEGGNQPQVVSNNKATLAYLANQACITPHIWQSRRDRLDYPDQLVFDLDPPDGDFREVRFAAGALREALEAVDLSAYVMATGSRGLHVLVPLDRKDDFEAVRGFAHALAEVVAGRHADRLTTEQRVEKRARRVYLDLQRNAFGQTTVAPYAVRAKAGAPVAVPWRWDELADPRLTSRSFNVQTVFERLEEAGDPWEGLHRSRQSLRERVGFLEDLGSASAHPS